MKKNPAKKSTAYEPSKIEGKWQKEWEKKKIYKTKDPISKDPTQSTQQKFYILDMFPYPSGEGLHVGHPKGYIATDVVSRMKRMQNFNVLHPMGFDAFGLPAENYAIKMKVNPSVAVEKNIKHYKKQLEILGFDYDWSRAVDTTDPKYYKWTQWIFLKLLEKGLAYESYESINWCPVDKTGLANEDIENGRCERCGTLVEKKPMRQWVLKITEYADRMLADLDAKNADGSLLLDWPESIKESQRNWIGRSEGAEFDFKIKNNSEKITVFTTRADTLFGVTYIVLAPEHKNISNLIEHVKNKEEILEYIEKTKTKTEIDRTDAKKEKTGVELKGIKAINPANGEEVPVWIADYVLADYGTGAVMAVPAHDERDFDFAKKYKLPVKSVIAWESGIKRENEERRDGGCAVVFDPKTQKYAFGHILSGGYDLYGGGVDKNENIEMGIIREVEEESGLHDFLYKEIYDDAFVHYYNSKKKVSRVARATCMLVVLNSISKKETKLEAHEDYELIWEDPETIIKWWKNNNINHDLDHWIIFMQKGVNKAIEQGFDKTNLKYQEVSSVYVGTGSLINSDTFTDSSSEIAREKITEQFGKKVVKYKLRDWVFSRQRYWGEPIPVLHDERGDIIPVSEKELPVILPKVKSYEPSGTGESPLATILSWVNVTTGKGRNKKTFRRETNTMPQWAGSSWYYLRYMDPDNNNKIVDPSKEKYWNEVDLYVGGAEHATRHLIYARFWHKFLYDIGVVSTIEPFKKLQSVGLIMAEDGRKMSKRWGNVINPDDLVKIYGADALRLYEMFMGPFEQAIAWNTNGLVGTRRFLEKVWKLAERITQHPLSPDSAESPTGSLTKEGKGDSVNIILNQTIKKVSKDIEEMRFNTAVSQMMICVNEMEKSESVSKNDFEILLKLLAPFAPHITEELWKKFGNKKSIHLEEWPTFDASFIEDTMVTIAIQVNGKVREVISIPKDAGESEVKSKAEALPSISKWIEGKLVKKLIFVPNRILNFIVDL